MSAAPKGGAHEESIHSSSSSTRPILHENDKEEIRPRVSYGPIPDSRVELIIHPESHDGERRSPLHSAYRMPSSMTDVPHAGLFVVPEIRTEPRDSKENRENKIVENSRDVKVESREVLHQSGKAEKEGRAESRGDDSKKVKYEREIRNESKNQVKIEKDVYGLAGSHPNWKEQHRVKRHSDVLGGGGLTGSSSFPQLRAKYEASKERLEVAMGNVLKERMEANKAVGETRVDPKSDEKYGEKDRKRKEGKHHEWVEIDKDRSDSRTNVQAGSSTNDYKEATREEKESERWERERERKDIPEEKERLKEREIDHVNREDQPGRYRNESEVADKTTMLENFALEQKKPKEDDAWRNVEREAKETRKERDGDVEGERPEKRSRCYDKESDEGAAEVDGGVDRERQAFSSGVQQRKRMLRPRSCPQVAGRDVLFKSRGQDAEGIQGKPEVSTIYKVGECMQELKKFGKNMKYPRLIKTMEVYIMDLLWKYGFQLSKGWAALGDRYIYR